MRFSHSIAALLLCALSFALGAELWAGGHGHDAEGARGAGATISVASDAASPAAADEVPCADPCHYGQAHLGHCLAHLPAGKAILRPAVRAVDWKAIRAVPADVYLRGPKRPPRFV